MVGHRHCKTPNHPDAACCGGAASLREGVASCGVAAPPGLPRGARPTTCLRPGPAPFPRGGGRGRRGLRSRLYLARRPGGACAWPDRSAEPSLPGTPPPPSPLPCTSGSLALPAPSCRRRRRLALRDSARGAGAEGLPVRPPPPAPGPGLPLAP